MLFMIEWLQGFAGLKSSGPNMEKTELDNLRKEIKKYKQKYANEDKEMAVSSDEDDVNRLALLILTRKKKKEIKLKQILQFKREKKIVGRGQRSSVSAEVYGLFNKKEAFEARKIPKTEDQKQRIIKKCMESFIFNSLDENELETVVNAFEEKRFKAGEPVITQGEQGEVVYLVDTGELDCSKIFKKGDPSTYLKTYKPGESFGELALLYNAPRAATIQAKTDVVLWALDRATFNNIVKEAAMY
jgi:hypothetical protein